MIVWAHRTRREGSTVIGATECRIGADGILSPQPDAARIEGHPNYVRIAVADPAPPPAPQDDVAPQTDTEPPAPPWTPAWSAPEPTPEPKPKAATPRKKKAGA